MASGPLDAHNGQADQDEHTGRAGHADQDRRAGRAEHATQNSRAGRDGHTSREGHANGGELAGQSGRASQDDLASRGRHTGRGRQADRAEHAAQNGRADRDGHTGWAGLAALEDGLAALEPVWGAGARALALVQAVLGAAEAPVGTTPKTLLWRKNKARLYRYTRTTPATHRTPLFLVLPLINRAYILDLRPGASLVEFLLARGFEVFLLDWGVPGDEDRGLDLDTLLTRYLPRALRQAQAATGAQALTLLGYCIGGTLATCYTALYPDAPVPIHNLVLFTTPIDFGQAGRFGAWTAPEVFPLQQLTEVLPLVPGSLPDWGAKLLNPLPSTLGTYVRLWERLADPSFDLPAWQAMYRWVNEGVPFPSAAYRQWISQFYQANRLVSGTLEIAGQRVHLERIRCPLLNVAAAADPIAPRPTTSAIVRHVSSTDTEELVLAGGHVGIVVGRAASTTLWPRVANWLDRHDA